MFVCGFFFFFVLLWKNVTTKIPLWSIGTFLDLFTDRYSLFRTKSTPEYSFVCAPVCELLLIRHVSHGSLHDSLTVWHDTVSTFNRMLDCSWIPSHSHPILPACFFFFFFPPLNLFPSCMCSVLRIFCILFKNCVLSNIAVLLCFYLSFQEIHGSLIKMCCVLSPLLFFLVCFLFFLNPPPWLLIPPLPTLIIMSCGKFLVWGFISVALIARQLTEEPDSWCFMFLLPCWVYFQFFRWKYVIWQKQSKYPAIQSGIII